MVRRARSVRAAIDVRILSQQRERERGGAERKGSARAYAVASVQGLRLVQVVARCDNGYPHAASSLIPWSKRSTCTASHWSPAHAWRFAGWLARGRLQQRPWHPGQRLRTHCATCATATQTAARPRTVSAVGHRQLSVALHPQLRQRLPLIHQHGGAVPQQVQPLVGCGLRAGAGGGRQAVTVRWCKQVRVGATTSKPGDIQPCCCVSSWAPLHAQSPERACCSSSCSLPFSTSAVSVGSTCRNTVWVGWGALGQWGREEQRVNTQQPCPAGDEPAAGGRLHPVLACAMAGCRLTHQLLPLDPHIHALQWDERERWRHKAGAAQSRGWQADERRQWRRGGGGARQTCPALTIAPRRLLPAPQGRG